MPKRTNAFQKLVKIINTQLAPSGAKVTESAMLYDSEADSNREVDILVEVVYLNCPVRIGIECTAAGRPIDTKAIEGFKEKHRKLGIQQTIVVSKNGFSGTAKKYAEKNQIKLLTFSAAKNERWSSIYERLDGLSMYGRTYSLKSVSLKVDADEAVRDFQMNTSVSVLSQGGWISIAEFSASLFEASEVGRSAFKELRENEEKVSDPWIEVGFNLGGKIEFKDKKGLSMRPQEIIIVMGYRSKYRNLNVGEVSYDGRNIVAGGFLDLTSGESAHIAIAEENGMLVGTLEMSSSMFPSTSENTKK